MSVNHHGLVFVNRIINLKKIKFIGFDLDHTLVCYNSKKFEEVAHQAMLEKLISEKGYPKSVLDLKCELSRAIRGLVVDKKNGNILKVNHYERIKESYHGTKKIEFSIQNEIYRGKVINLNDENYDSLDSSFELAYVALYAQLVDLKDANPLDGIPSYHQIAEDLRDVLDIAHRDGTLKKVVRTNLSTYIQPNPQAAALLERFRKYEKHLFILTNSDYDYTKTLMAYAIEPYLKDHNHWQSVFDYILTSTHKPHFFYNTEAFLKIEPRDGVLSKYDDALIPGIYHAGCSSLFQKSIQAEGDEILYLGDHIFGDVVRLKKLCDWRTGLVIEELEEEVERNKKARPVINQISTLTKQKEAIEWEINALYAENIEEGKSTNRKRIHELKEESSKLDQSLSTLILSYNQLFNPYWGEIMRAGNDQSRYAMQVERYACIYMSKITDLMFYSPRYYFRPQRRLLPYEAGE